MDRRAFDKRSSLGKRNEGFLAAPSKRFESVGLVASARFHRKSRPSHPVGPDVDEQALLPNQATVVVADSSFFKYVGVRCNM